MHNETALGCSEDVGIGGQGPPRWQLLMLLCHSVVPSLVMVYWFPHVLALGGLLVCP